MAMPQNVASTEAVFAPTINPVKRAGPVDNGIAYERAGLDIQDPSQGVNVKDWTLNLVGQADDTQQVIVSAPGSPDTVLITGTGITEIDLAFDQNMQPFVAYVQAGQAKYRWFDSVASAFVITNLPSGSRTPRCTLDDHRVMQLGSSDIILMYCRGSTLYMRMQRERYETEHTIAAVGANGQLVYVAMNVKNRLQWQLHKASVAGDQFTTLNDPFLGDVVLDLCLKSGIKAEHINTKELYDDFIQGYCITSDAGVDAWLNPLSQYFFFDATEHSRQINFYKRGRDVVKGIHFSELVATNDSSDPMQMKRADVSKLPRSVSVMHLDPEGNYTRNKQTQDRKSNLVKGGKANMSLEATLAMSADNAAAVALRELKMYWYELLDYSWSLPIGYGELVPGDVFNYFAKDGSTHRIRIMSKNEDSDVLKFEGKQDGSIDVYDSNASGLSLPYPQSTTPGIIGETLIEILNIPVLLDQDDELGIYIAIAGISDAWRGASVEISTDGVSYIEAYRSEVPATMGKTLTALLPEVSPVYPSDQTVEVLTNFTLDSITEGELLNNGNRCVIGDELVQYQTATLLGMVGAKYRYRLSNLIRARYNTLPEAWPTDTRFILLDEAITFLRAQTWMLGMEVWFKPISFGVTDDESTPVTFDFTIVYSQYEWSPHAVTAERDGSDNVTVSWIPRPRLGIEIAPRNSQYFTGYRVVFSDDFTVDLGDVSTYVRASSPAGVSAHVVGLNSITGPGQDSLETDIV